MHRTARRGMWKDGVTGETPAEYKRRYAQASNIADSSSSSGSAEQAEKREQREGWFRRLWSK